jgi:hypothetical protein
MLCAPFVTSCSIITDLSDYAFCDGDSVVDGVCYCGASAANADGTCPDAGSADAGPLPDAGCELTSCGGACVDTDVDPLHCGRCDNACDPPDNATAECNGGLCDFSCLPGFVRTIGSCTPTSAPRPIAPLSTATATSRRPTFRWELRATTDGARIQVCADRACASVIEQIDVTGTSAAPTADLPPGVVFWRLFGRMGTDVGAEASPVWQLYVGVRSAPVDTSFGTTLDVNGDGFADVAVGAPGQGAGGSVFIYHGAPSGIPLTPSTTLVNPADQLDGSFGSSVASAGDVNGDGYADLIVGAPRQDSPAMDEGNAFVYHGGPSGLTATPSRTLDNPANQAGGEFGRSVASAGDVNGDGYADVIVGAQLQDGGAMDEGNAFVYHGGSGGIAGAPNRTLDNPANQASGTFGASVASAGDVNGDGYADIVIGAPAQEAGATREGNVFVYHGSASGIVGAVATITLDNPTNQESGYFGESVASAGDVNGDGYADLVVGAWGQEAGTPFEGNVFVYHGGSSGIAGTPNTPLDNPTNQSGGLYGYSVSSAGDVNGDGYADLIVGARYQGTLEEEGKAYVHHGGSGGVSGMPDRSLDSPHAQENGMFGARVASAGDVNGDGYADVVVGAARQSQVVGSFNVGNAYIYHGSPGGVAATPSTALDNPTSEAGGSFGASVAWVGELPAEASSRGTTRLDTSLDRRSRLARASTG